MDTVKRHALLTVISLLLGSALVFWVEPNSTAGTTFLVALVVAIVNLFGVFCWPERKPPEAASPAARDRLSLWLSAAVVSLLLTPAGAPAQEAASPAPRIRSASDAQPIPRPAWVCRLTTGPRAGATQLLVLRPGMPQRSGQPCSDGRGSSGIVLMLRHGEVAPPAPPRPVEHAARRPQNAETSPATGCGNCATMMARPSPPPPPPPAQGFSAGAAPPLLRPTRAYMRASDIPPRGVAAYGVVALRALPTPVTQSRLAMVCQSFLASLPRQDSLPRSVSLAEQMVTVWPLGDPSAPQARSEDCSYLTQHYDLFGGLSAIEDARSPDHPLTGRGPYLIGWSPSGMRGVKDAVVLVLDMSRYDSQESFDEVFQLWQQKIVENPDLWRKGFDVESLKLALRDFSDHYGNDILSGLGFWEKKPGGT